MKRAFVLVVLVAASCGRPPPARLAPEGIEGVVAGLRGVGDPGEVGARALELARWDLQRQRDDRSRLWVQVAVAVLDVRLGLAEVLRDLAGGVG